MEGWAIGGKKVQPNLQHFVQQRIFDLDNLPAKDRRPLLAFATGEG
jgi:hypothetical protein